MEAHKKNLSSEKEGRKELEWLREGSPGSSRTSFQKRIAARRALFIRSLATRLPTESNTYTHARLSSD